MPRIIKVKVGNVDRDAYEVDFEIGREEWNEYKLVDGGRVRVKTTVQKIARLLDAQGKPEFTPDGDPNVVVRHNTQVIASE